MSDIQELDYRVTELEIQTALQEDLIGSLNDTIAKMQQALDLPQGQLR
ncbi:SlyX family protein, partial [Achromobacter xylosoxidans]